MASQLEAGAHELRNLAACFVGDVYVDDAGAPAVLLEDGGGDKPLSFRGGKIIDADLLGDGGVLAVVGERREGEVRQGEDGAAHDAAEGVPVIVGEGKAADGVLVVDLVQRHAVKGGEFVLAEVFPGLFYGFEVSHAFLFIVVRNRCLRIYDSKTSAN